MNHRHSTSDSVAVKETNLYSLNKGQTLYVSWAPCRNPRIP